MRIAISLGMAAIVALVVAPAWATETTPFITIVIMRAT